MLKIELANQARVPGDPFGKPTLSVKVMIEDSFGPGCIMAMASPIVKSDAAKPLSACYLSGRLV